MLGGGGKSPGWHDERLRECKHEAKGQKDLVWRIERSDSTNNDDDIIVAYNACRRR
jgi:hypothetical protein